MTSKFPLCQLCGERPASCKSHIIPKRFYKRIRGNEKHLYEVYVGEEVKRRFSQNGIWEQGILCPECDTNLGVFDQYAYEVLPEKLDDSRIKHLAPDICVYDLGLLDAKKFQQFLVSLVWRASCSKHEMFKFLNVSVYEKRLKNILTAEDSSWLTHIDCVCVHLKPFRYDKILLPPFMNKRDGVNFIQFYLFPWKLLIKVENFPFGNTFAGTTLKSGTSTYALMMNTFSKGELNLLADFQRKLKRYKGVL